MNIKDNNNDIVDFKNRSLEEQKPFVNVPKVPKLNPTRRSFLTGVAAGAIVAGLVPFSGGKKAAAFAYEPYPKASSSLPS